MLSFIKKLFKSVGLVDEEPRKLQVSRRPELIAERQSRAQTMRKSGVPINVIAKELGVTRVTVYSYLRGVQDGNQGSTKAS